MRLITFDDFIDTYFKIIQRGGSFFLSKFSINKEKRTKSAFNNSLNESSYAWNIPKVKERWNFLITGNKKTTYNDYLISNTFKNKNGIKLLSIGSGVSNREIEMAENTEIFKEIICIDISENLMKTAEKNAKSKGLKNIKFITLNIYEFDFKPNYFDVVYFKASLHHFDKVDTFLKKYVCKTLQEKGLLIIDEFVGANRLQFKKSQIKAINNVIETIPKKYRTRYKSNFRKNKFRGPGLVRMIIADPSECIDSESILPSIHKYFNPILEKPYGGNLLISAFRDISHHFYILDDEKEKILEGVFLIEDEFLKTHKSDYLFGIYQNKK